MSLIVRHLGLVDYLPTWHKMRDFTAARGEHSADEIWFLQHPPVYTLGLKTQPQHLLNPGEIPVVQIDRGGQVTYHGPGQLVVYPLLNLERHKLGARSLVSLLENSIIALLSHYGINAKARADAPGVYVRNEKIASIGLRITRGCCYHGLAINIAMDLAPFRRINPCGYAGLQMTELRKLMPNVIGEDEFNAVTYEFERILTGLLTRRSD